MNKELEETLNEMGYNIITHLGSGANGSAYLVEKDNKRLILKTTLNSDKWKNEVSSLLSIYNRDCDTYNSFILCIRDFFQITTSSKIFSVILTDAVDNADTLSSYINSMIQKDQPISNENLQIITLKLLEQCSYLHSIHVTHNDIKPDNIIISTNQNDTINKVYLIDYGEACKDDICFFGGTPRFWSPEHVAKSKMIQPFDTLKKYDVWALGLTLFLIANGGLYPYPEKDYYITDTLEVPVNSLENTLDISKASSTGEISDYNDDDDFDFPLDIEFEDDSKSGVDKDILTKRLIQMKIYNVIKANQVEFDEIKQFFENDNKPKKSSSGYDPIDKIIDLMLNVNSLERPDMDSLFAFFQQLIQATI